MDINTSIIEALSDKVKGYFQEQKIKYDETAGAEQILADFLDNIDRWILSKPRKVYFSKEIKSSLCSDDVPSYANNLKFVAECIEEGKELNFNQTKYIFDSRCQYRDILLNAWKIHHIHLSQIVATSKRGMNRNRSDHLLFCVVTDAAVYCLDVLEHPGSDTFFCYNLLKILHNNEWMPIIGFLPVGEDYVPGSLSPHITCDADLTKLYMDYKVNVGFEFENMAYFQIFGVTSTGDNTTNLLRFLDLKKIIEEQLCDGDQFIEIKEFSVNKAEKQISIVIVVKRNGNILELEIRNS